jgi:GTP cyclohydrolase I
MSSKITHMEDVAAQSPGASLALTIAAVGLENVQTQIQFQGKTLPAKAQANVSLIDPQSRGIHMSRLYKIITEIHARELNWAALTEALESMLATHANLSDAGELEFAFEYPILRAALASETEGWRVYPMRFKVRMAKGQPLLKQIEVRVLYSSTCPCSASLSRELIRAQFESEFKEQTLTREQMAEWLTKASSIAGVPHSQRSEAIGWFTVTTDVSPMALIDAMENALQTAVQAAVKRDDEQAFAQRNAHNLMFCEDAVRRLKAAFLKSTDVADFTFEVRHFESLHPHDVFAKITKNS